jgi:hypothetical protein
VVPNEQVVLSAAEMDAWDRIVDELRGLDGVSRRARFVVHAVRWWWCFARAWAIAGGFDIAAGELGGR